MSYNFREAAQKAVSNSFLQAGRTKKSWDDVENEEVTIVGMDVNEGPKVDDKGNIVSNPDTGEVEMMDYVTVTLKEYPENYFGGFGALDRMVKKILVDFNSPEEASEELEAYGGIVITAYSEKRRGGGSIRRINVL